MRQPEHPIIIDIEASGFGQTSYPIEIGLVLENHERFCTLIAPQSDWTHWADSAEAVHGISRDNLINAGKSALDVALYLNSLLDGVTVYSDGWVVDKPWLTVLFHAAGIDMKFHLSPLEMILSEAQMTMWADVKTQVINDSKLRRHRASNDAWIIQETYRRTLLQQA